MRNIRKNNVYTLKLNIYVATTYLLRDPLIEGGSVVFLGCRTDGHVTRAPCPLRAESAFLRLCFPLVPLLWWIPPSEPFPTELAITWKCPEGLAGSPWRPAPRCPRREHL